MEALELYLLGRARQSRRTAEDNLKSIEYFRRAVDADPQYIPALTGLAESLLNGLSLNRTPLEDVKFEVEPLIDRAMQAQPESARGDRGQGLAAHRGVPLRRGAAAVAARDQDESRTTPPAIASSAISTTAGRSR